MTLIFECGLVIRIIGGVAYPARFEPAAYALEEIVAAGISNYFNSLKHKHGAV